MLNLHVTHLISEIKIDEKGLIHKKGVFPNVITNFYNLPTLVGQKSGSIHSDFGTNVYQQNSQNFVSQAFHMKTSQRELGQVLLYLADVPLASIEW